MARVYDITDKLEFNGNPILKIKDEEIEVNTDVKSILKVTKILEETINLSPDDILEACGLLFSKASQKKIEKLNLQFTDFQKVVKMAMDIAYGNDEETEKNLLTPDMT